MGGAVKAWWSAAELADMNLPGLSAKRNRVVDIATAQRWAERYDAAGDALWRPRAGRGGGYEYHFTLFPTAAIRELAKRGLLEPSEARLGTGLADDPEATVAAGWGWYEAQTDKIKDEAKRRLIVVQQVELYGLKMGLTQTAAVALVAREVKVSTATIWNWLALLKGVAAADRLQALAPRRKGGGVQAVIDEDLFQIFKSDFLRPSAPTYQECWRRTQALAAAQGKALPHVKTLQRRLEAEVPAEVINLKRRGMEAVINMIPAQKRSRADLHALQAVNIDGHKWDVFVRFPATAISEERIGRPISVCIQDLYSNKMLAWRTGQVESVTLTRLAFADVFKNFGIPRECTLDNGRAFASKQITGGAKTRFRFKIREDENLGLLTTLGVATHWAKPHHGQAKPIERAFRDLEEIISKHPACQGAYTGNHIDAKPEDYASRAIDLHVFEALIAQGMAEYNARQGRRGGNATGQSYDDVFMASHAKSPIGKATPEQLRLALLAADNVRCDRKTGQVSIYGNSYFAHGMYGLAGQMVTVRFDPDNLQSEVHVYKATGEFVCSAPVVVAMGFYDVDGAKQRAKVEGDIRKHTRAAARAQDLLSAADLAAMHMREQSRDLAEHPSAPEPKVVRPVRSRGGAALAPISDRDAVVDRFQRAIERQEQAPVRRHLSVLDGGLAPQQEPERPKK